MVCDLPATTVTKRNQRRADWAKQRRLEDEGGDAHEHDEQVVAEAENQGDDKEEEATAFGSEL